MVFLNFPSWKDPRLKGQLYFDEAVFDCTFSAADPNKVIVALGDDGHAQVDASNPEQPHLLVKTNAPHPVTRVVADDSGVDAYLHCGSAGFWQADYPPFQVPELTRLLEGSDAVYAAASKGNIVYVSDSASQIEIWNVADPAAPVLTGTVPSPATAVHLGLWGDTLIASCLKPGIAIYDISNPLSPVQTAAFAPREEDIDGGSHHTDLFGNLLAIADGYNGVVIYDMGDLTTPLATWNEESGALRGVAFGSADILWCAHHVSGLVGLDISTITAPETIVERGYNSQDYKTLKFRDDTIYLSTEQGLLVIDAADPEDPDQITALSAGYNANLFSFHGDRLVVGCGSWGFSEFDITDREAIFQTRQFNSPGYALSPVLLDNGAYFLADREGGAWTLIQDSCGGDILLLPCDEDSVPVADPLLFTWDPGSYEKFRVEVSIDPSFPSGKKKTRTSKTSSKKWLKEPDWVPSKEKWKKIRKNAKNTRKLYWRVIRVDSSDNKFPSETRIFYLAD